METMPYLSISSSANLVVLEDGAVRSYPLNENQIWKIGRKNPESENDIELESKIVSRKHGQIQSVDGEWYYIDNGSLNGTYYNGSKIKANDHGEFDAVKLSNGDILRIDSDSLDYPEERGVFFLFTTEGIGNQWKTVTLNKKEISFGRNEENDITIPLSYVSGKHMVIRRRDNEYFVMDCDSMAGAWLNGEEIHGEAKLKEKDMIAICDCIMILCGNKIIYNIPVLKNRTTKQSIEEVDLSDHPVILCADIKSRKVKNNRGFGKKELIKDIKLEIQEGTLVAIIGGTGAGKSTVMNCLNGSDTGGMEGSIEYKGIDLIKKFSQMKWIIGSVPQENIFNEEMENVLGATFQKYMGFYDSKIAPYKIHYDKILYVEFLNRATVLHFLNGVQIKTSYPLKYWVEKLTKYGFAQPYKCYVVNLKYISGISKDERDLFLSNNEKIPLSKFYKKTFVDNYYRSLFKSL